MPLPQLLRMLFCSSLGMACVSAAATAQVLLPDGEFDGTLGSWHAVDGDAELTLAANDATNCAPDSDSALAAQSAALAAAGRNFVPDCISPVTAGATYSFGGQLRFLTGQAVTGSARFELVWTSGLDCTGTALSPFPVSQPLVTTALAGNWVPSRQVAVAPAGAQAASLRMRSQKDPAGGTLSVRIDSAFFAQGDLVFAEDFEIGTTCRWSATTP